MREPEQKRLTFDDEEVQIVTGGLAVDVWLPGPHEKGFHIFPRPREFFVINGGHDPAPNTTYGGGLLLTVKTGNALARDWVQATGEGDTVYCRYFPERSAWLIAKLS